MKDIVVDEGVLRPAPDTVSHESARNAARGHLYRACRAVDTVERESLSASTTVHPPGPLAMAVCEEVSGRMGVDPSRAGKPNPFLSMP